MTTSLSLHGVVLGALLAAAPTSALRRNAPPDLRVEARLPQESTGTMHFADKLTLRIGTAKPLVLKNLVPIPGPHLRLGESTFLLLGWSSGGAGMQTLHALSLAVRGRAVTFVEQMTLDTDRTSSMLVVRSGEGGPARLGVPEPPAGLAYEASEWALRTVPDDDARLDLDGILGLSFEVVTGQPGDVCYSPPFDKRPLPKRVAWISVSPSGHFALPARASTPDSLLRRLYAAHQPWSGKDVRVDRDALAEGRLARLLDESLLGLFRVDDNCKRSTGGVGLLELDPFLAAQDYGLGLSDLGIQCVTAGKSATCKVSFQLFSDQPDTRQILDYRLVLSPEGWRIHDIEYQRGLSLAATLSQPCE
jgi:hypothetical protein